MAMATSSASPTEADDSVSWDATLTLLRWRQTRRGYDNDDTLLQTAFALLASDAHGAFGAASRLRLAEARCNVPADRIATELIHLALLLIAKPRRDEAGATIANQSRAVLQLLHLGLKALRGTAPASEGGASLAIPMNACNLLLAAMADTLESVRDSQTHGDAHGDAAITDVLQVFVFLFGMSNESTNEHDDAPLATPSFNMYKPPTNVFSAFMQRACTAVFAQLAHTGPQQAKLVKLVLAIMRVFQELQFSQVNKKKVFVAIAKTSFREIAAYRHALVTHATTVDGVAAILDVLDRIIVDALFDSEHLREYDSALVHIRMWQDETIAGDDDDGSTKLKHKKQRRKNQTNNNDAAALVSYQRHLFDELKAYLSDAAVAHDAKASIGSLLEVLVRGFSTRIRAAANDKIEDTRADLKSSKKRVASVIATTSTAYSPFKFWAELCGVAFGAFESVRQQQQHRNQDDALTMLVGVYDSLFSALCDADVYRVTEDTEEQEQFYMMQTILARFVELLRMQEASDATRRRVCSVISNAVRCTPNLVNSSLVVILDVLGASSAVVDASSASMVELLHAYESMRLVDAFLRACCSTDDTDGSVATGLLTIFSHSATEAALRRTYMTLPPGQLEIVWRLLTDKLAVLCGTRRDQAERVAPKMALVRLLLALFLQEIHITPQTRTKIGELVRDSHEKLLAPLAGRVARVSVGSKKDVAFSAVDRELFSVFGEFLALYDGLAPAVRAETLDVVLTALDTKLVPVMTSLLAGDGDQVVGAAAGIVKIGVHTLRRRDGRPDASANVAPLIVGRMVQWRCWDAVAFYLPELVADLDEGRAAALYTALVESYVDGDAAAERVLRDAAFYEIAPLQRVAVQVFTTVLDRQHGRVGEAEFATWRRLFDHLLAMPTSYVDTTAPASGALLVAVLRIHTTIATATAKVVATEDNAGSSTTATTTLATIARWIERYLVAIAAAAGPSSEASARVATWTEFVLLDAVVVDGSSERLVRVALEYCATEPTASSLDAVLSKLLQQTTPRGYATSAIVLEAIAQLQLKHKPSTNGAATATTRRFVESLIASIEATPSMVATHESATSFQLLRALVRYAASLSTTTTDTDREPRRAAVVRLLETHLGSALATAMQSTIVDDRSSSSKHASRYQFFATVCETFHLLRPTVTLETFGCLLAVALVCAAETTGDNEAATDHDQPLACLVQHANKDEFRLLVATVERELLEPQVDRRVAALKALTFTLETDKKLSSTRRDVLGACKTALVARFTQLLTRALGDTDDQSDRAPVLCVWTLRVFVLFYCKAELFTWKPHELLQVFAGFQPLTALAAMSSTTHQQWTPSQLHAVWLLSYNLLLRVVRHHFASLVNGVPHMVDALNALLRMLLAATRMPAMAPFTTEWAANLARLYGYLKPQDAALRKHVVYVLLTYVHGATQGALPLALQLKLRPGVFALLEMCSLFEKEQLYASLDAAGKSLLKSLDTSYKLTYRYAGKV